VEEEQPVAPRGRGARVHLAPAAGCGPQEPDVGTLGCEDLEARVGPAVHEQNLDVGRRRQGVQQLFDDGPVLKNRDDHGNQGHGDVSVVSLS
jgi:hypothetical protein